MDKKAAEFIAKLLRLRQSGTHGTVVPMHRALRRIRLEPSSILAIILLPVFFDLLLWVNLKPITELWGAFFDFWISKLHLVGHVSYATMKILGTSMPIPFPDLPTTLPSHYAVWGNGLVSLALLALTKFIPQKNYLPASYIARVALIIQISASLYFLIKPESPPYELGVYIEGILTLGLYLLLLLSPLLALIYYIFDFPFWRKGAATALVIVYFIIALPFQYMLHALIISSVSILFMPVLYLLFGALLNTLMFVSWYVWAMTWAGKTDKSSFTD